MAVETRHQRFEPPRRRLHIGVQQDVVIGLDPLESAVVAAGKSVVAIHAEHPHRRKFALQHPDGVIRRAVVGHDDLDSGRGRRNDRRQKTTQMSYAVPVQYDDLND